MDVVIRIRNVNGLDQQSSARLLLVLLNLYVLFQAREQLGRWAGVAGLYFDDYISISNLNKEIQIA